MYLVKDLYKDFGKHLNLKLIVGKKGFNREIKKGEVHRPGLRLAGFKASFSDFRILIFGSLEVKYLKSLNEKTRKERLKDLFTPSVPAVIMCHDLLPPAELKYLCSKNDIPLFKTNKTTVELLSQMFFMLHEQFTPVQMIHGTLVEVFGMGVLIQGESAIGKSETALGLIERGHRLISDDIVKVKKRGTELVGSGPELTRHIMEIRGIGIINVAHLYGAVCVRPDARIDLIVQMEKWKDEQFYDRVGNEEKYSNILGLSVPFYLLPVKLGRDIILLIETVALNQRLKIMGYHSAQEFTVRLKEAINKKVLCENCKNSKSFK